MERMNQGSANREASMSEDPGSQRRQEEEMMLGHRHLGESHLHEDHLDDGHDLGVDGVINTVVNPEDGEVPGEVQDCLQDNEEDSSVFDQEEVLSDSEDYDDVIDTSTVKRVQMNM